MLSQRLMACSNAVRSVSGRLVDKPPADFLDGLESSQRQEIAGVQPDFPKDDRERGERYLVTASLAVPALKTRARGRPPRWSEAMIQYAEIAAVRKEMPAPTSPVRMEFPAHKPPVPAVTLDTPKPARIAAVRAALVTIGAPAIEPAPLVDATKRRGRPKLDPEAAAAARERRRAWNRERMAARRAAAKAAEAQG